MSLKRENRTVKSNKKEPKSGKEPAASVPLNRTYLPSRKRRTIKVDRVNPGDLSRIDVRFFCDDCSHYSPSEKRCTIGYIPQHTRSEQAALYDRTGMMAFCRFLEID